ncbi:MAG: hypothetical protein J6C49_03990, partial [Elusimicrobiaceae bacterium]|nr:hypothetical protein [Elusimicrobiaceae bacterium]
IKGNTLSLGNGNGEGKISFQNVRIQTGNMESMNAQGMKASNLNLFGKAFPSCKDANSASSGQMQWTSLKLKGADSKELYLACGNVAEAAGSCSDRTYKLANKSVCCPSIPYTDSDCWKAVPVPETWTWGSPTTITNHSCTGVFFVTTEKPSYWGDATSWCVDKSRIKRVSSPVEGVDDLTFTVAAASGGNCTIKQPGRTSCYENEAYFSNAERTFASAGMNFSCTISGTKCTCTFNAWAGVPCVKSSSASTSYQPNGW